MYCMQKCMCHYFFIFEREMVWAYCLDLIASSRCFWQQLNAADTAIHVSYAAYIIGSLFKIV